MSSAKSKKRMSWSSRHILKNLPDNVLKFKRPQASITETGEPQEHKSSGNSMHRLSMVFGTSDTSLSDRHSHISHVNSSEKNVSAPLAARTTSASSNSTSQRLAMSSTTSLPMSVNSDFSKLSHISQEDANKSNGTVTNMPVAPPTTNMAVPKTTDYAKRRETFMLPSDITPPSKPIDVNDAAPFLTLDLGDQNNLSFPQQFLGKEDESFGLTESTVNTISSDLTADTTADVDPLSDRKSSAVSFHSLDEPLSQLTPGQTRPQIIIPISDTRQAIISKGLYILDPREDDGVEARQLTADELYNPFIEPSTLFSNA